MYVFVNDGEWFPQDGYNGISEITATTYKISSFAYRGKQEIGPLRVLSLRGLGAKILQSLLLPLRDRIGTRGL